VENSLKEAAFPYLLSIYSGQNTYERAKEHAAQAKENGCNVIVGVGGGRIMHQAKATAHFAGDLPVVQIPTSIATCAAFAPLSVMYTEEGASLGSLRYDHEVNAVILDMDVICKEPPRYAASGIMDGMAKMIEIQNGRSEIRLDEVSIGLYTAFTLAEMSYRIYEKEAHQACRDIADGKLTKAVEDITYLNMAVAGIVSGVSKGFGQTALGHETYELVRTHFTKEAAPYLHGEIVAIGDALQCAFNGHPEQIPAFHDFMRSMNMPITLQDIGIDPDSPKMENLFQDLFHSPFMEPTPENEAKLREAMKYLTKA
jgi:glycerol dehydrogenase